jgi:nitrogen fixation/metabolism regulation signal transduction histidine kinase
MQHTNSWDSRTSRWAVRMALALGLPLAVFLMFLLAVSTKNTEQPSPVFAWLYWINFVVAGVLLLMVLALGLRLGWRLHKRRFGSRLLFKLAAIFALVGVLPGVVIYTVSYQFVARSIETWFDVKVEGALSAGLNLGRTTLNVLQADLQAKARNLSVQIAEDPTLLSPLAMEQLRQQLGLQQITVFDGNGTVLVTAGGDPFSLIPDIPGPNGMRQLRTMGSIADIEGGDDGTGHMPQTLKLRVVVGVPSRHFILPGHSRYLQLIQNVPQAISNSALEVQRAYGEYQERALGREGLKRMYISTLTLTLFLAVFLAVLLAVVLGNQLAKPLLLLADGMKAVAEGDLRQKPALERNDELGVLVRSFNAMTNQLAEARAQAQYNHDALEASRAYLQSVLDNLSAGVMVLGSDQRLALANPSATRLLRAPLQGLIGQPLQQLPSLEAFARTLSEAFASLDEQDHASANPHWLQQIEYQLPNSDASITLLVRGARLALPGQPASVVVFDDITEVISAQRSLAWAEVARRLAHEIKNPLTPIQLSAERLQMKLAPKLEGADRDMLQRSTTTIVNQVQAMQHMVNDFRDYARLPAGKPEPMNLNTLIRDVLNLYASLSAHDGSSADEDPEVRADLADPLPDILGNATQLRQVIHNLLQNAIDAVSAQAERKVRIRTEALPSPGSPAPRVRLSVTDNGPGFSEKILSRAFEPYVTSKPRGTGLGLAVVKKITEEHHARIEIQNLQADGRVCGARVSLIFPGLAQHTAAPAPLQPA